MVPIYISKIISLLHLNTPRTKEFMLVQITWEVRARLLAKGKYK
jgi:hypothetical protein